MSVSWQYTIYFGFLLVATLGLVRLELILSLTDTNLCVEILVTIKHDGRTPAMDPHDNIHLYPFNGNIIEIGYRRGII